MEKYILTGGPGSGKSSILLALEETGEYIVREAAEDIIRLQQAKGIAYPWEQRDFQERILNLQIQREKRIPREVKRAFIDRGIPDGLAYTQTGSETEQRIYKATSKYDGIFLVENLGETETNEVRRENQNEALELERKLSEIYANMGYTPIRINSGPLNERVKQIRKALGK